MNRLAIITIFACSLVASASSYGQSRTADREATVVNDSERDSDGRPDTPSVAPDVRTGTGAEGSGAEECACRGENHSGDAEERRSALCCVSD